VREARLHHQAPTRAFTLIELLTVISIIAILSAITFGVVKGVKERSSISQARAEVAVIAQSLEMYKLQYGDYPQTVSSSVMLQSLIGKVGPTGVAMTQKALIDIARFNLSTDGGDPFTNAALTLVDPFGNSYQYYYYTVSTGANITKRSFLLFSQGPDGKTTAPTNGGIISTTDADNSDNIYAN